MIIRGFNDKLLVLGLTLVWILKLGYLDWVPPEIKLVLEKR